VLEFVFLPVLTATYEWFRGFIFLLMTGVSVLGVILVIFIRVIEKRDRSIEKIDIANEEY
jgi:hypothetical protein